MHGNTKGGWSNVTIVSTTFFFLRNKGLWHGFDVYKENGSMIHFLESIGLLKDKSSNSFKLAPAIVIAVLILSFVAATFYILFSSLAS